MGADYYARAVIGHRIPAKAVVEAMQPKDGPTRARGCGHPDPGTKFCPECGSPAWKETAPRRLSGRDALDAFRETVEAMGGAVHDADGAASVIVGYGTEDAEVERNPVRGTDYDPERVAAVLAKVEDYLRDLGVPFSKATLGLWAAMSWSC